MTDQFALPGVAPAPWHAFKNPRGFGWSVADAKGTGICSQVTEDFAKLIASIPAMVEEIERLQTAWHDAECGRDRLRALNAELREALSSVKVLDANRMYIGVQADEFSCASAMISDFDRDIFLKWKAKRDAILAKSEVAS